MQGMFIQSKNLFIDKEWLPDLLNLSVEPLRVNQILSNTQNSIVFF